VPETKILSDNDHPGITLANEHISYELLRGLPGEVGIERYHPYLVGPVT